MNIKLNNDTSIDLDRLIESRLLIQANSGGGKSWAARRVIEQSFGHKQIIVIDPEGEFGNMRGRYDFVYAGKDGDAPVESRSAAMLATRLLELKASAIIDLYELPPRGRKEFVRIFFDAMVNAPKDLWHDCLVVLDEAHKFAPEKEQSESLEAVIDMASRGRKRGYCLIPATQRPAKLSKDVAAECNNKLIGRASLDIDRKRSAEELGFTSKEEVLSLRNLEPGEFYVFGPAISRDVQKIMIGDVKVKPPVRGQGKHAPPAPTDKVKKILEKLADLPQEAEKEIRTANELKKEVRRLNQELVIARKEMPKPTVTKIQKIEVPAIGKRNLERLQKTEKSMRRILGNIKEANVRNSTEIGIVEKHFEKFSQEIAKAIYPVMASPDTSIAPTGQLKPGEVFGIDRSVGVDKTMVVRGERKPNGTIEIKNVSEVPLQQRKILDALLWLEAIGVSQANKNQLAFLSDQKSTSGGYFGILSALKNAGLLIYPGPGLVSLTDAGRSIAEIPERPLSTDELHRQIQGKVSSSQWNILKTLVEKYPNPISKNDLAEIVGAKPTSGGYFGDLSILRTLGLIDYPSGGMVVALPILFLL